MIKSSFLNDTLIYAARIRLFTKTDWLVYAAWVGMMLGLLFCVSSFFAIGFINGVQYPAYVWNIPFGTAVFVIAIAFDTIGHRTVYKDELAKGENLVHHITIFAGITSTLLLCLGYHFPAALWIPATCFTALTVFYSMIDEALHWVRYFQLQSDRVEMWSHFFIFVGHTIMSIAWLYWFLQGYPGVKETLPHLARFTFF
jgi:hypothetical protein